MSFNVRGSNFGIDGSNRWKYRAALNVKTIQQHEPDLIGFQELQRGNLLTYRRHLQGYAYVLGRHYQNFPPFMYPAIFWRSSVFTLLASGSYWLNRNPNRPWRDWRAAHLRSAAWVLLRHLPSGRNIVHVNTHLDHVSERARLESSKLMLDWIETSTSSDCVMVVITGDFNCNPQSPAYRLFLSAGFTDAYIAAGGVETNTCHAFQGEGYMPPAAPGRVDWILARSGSATPLRVVACEILRDAQPPVYPSDHYPVLATLGIPS